MATEDIFYENPRSFKMDRKSLLASKLKSTISKKLLHFIGNYTDDVLAEYILVLVCNGKHQLQARDDLEAFLGERSGEFVSWLWGILLKTVLQSHLPSDSSNLKDVIVRSACDDVDNEQRSCRLKDLQNHGNGNADNLLSNGEKDHLSTSLPRPVVPVDEVYEGCRQMKLDPSARDINTKDLCRQLHKMEIPRNSATAEFGHHEILKHDTSREKGSGNSSGGEQSMQNVEHKKVFNINHNELLHRIRYSPKRELVSRNSQSVMTENPHPRVQAVTKVAGRRLSMGVVDPVSKQNAARPRGNVWDRLGKPCQDNTIRRSKDIDVHGINVIRKQLERGSNKICSPNDANNSGRKRQFNEILPSAANESVSFGDGNYRHVQFKEPFEEFERLPSVKCSRSKMLNSVISELRKSDRADIYHAFETPEVVVNTKANAMCQRKLTRKVSETTPNWTWVLGAKSGIINKEEGVNTNLKPMESEVPDNKLNLHEIETKASELRLKQVHMTNHGHINSMSSTGALNHPEEDNESRTVFVTNVHFSATKEALSLHFAKCGVVVKVIILSDPVTSQPRGSAYITFGSKESVEKAVAVSGSSFWSRTLKVMRKAEIPMATPAAVQIAGKPSQSWCQQPKKRVNLLRPYPSSHLQWRRDQTITNSNPGGKLEASRTVVQQGGADFGGQVRNRSLTYVRTTQAEAQVAGTMKTSTAA